MYSWGDDTSTWKSPGAYDYGEAKKPYLDDLAKEAKKEGSRVYSTKKTPGLELVDPKGKTLHSGSENVVLWMLDGTGSMQKSPAEFFDRAPLIYQTLSTKRDDVDLSFSVIGDARWDKWPVQVGNLERGLPLDKQLKALHAEGGGGAGNKESYELWAYFAKEHVTTPNAISPTIILMGDEKFYDKINPTDVQKIFGDTIQGPIDSMSVWKSLTERFDVYLLHKEYATNDADVVAQWKEALGDQKVIPVYDTQRFVDHGLAILAAKWGFSDDFEKSIAARQDGKTVKAVMESLRAVSIPSAGGNAGGNKPKKSKSLEMEVQK